MKNNFLEDIVENKKAEVLAHKRQLPVDELKQRVRKSGRDFLSALTSKKFAIIAEIKKASPSKGIISNDFNYLRIAEDYEKNGAAAISVLTEEKYFLGSLGILQEISEKASIPILRKDFIIDPYQIYEANYYGADAVLLITSLLSGPQLSEYLGITRELGLAALVEVHDEKEFLIALDCKAGIIGINNRNLETFKVDLETTFELIKLRRDNKCIIVSESGIKTSADIERLKKAGINAALVGEALMKAKDTGRQLKELAS